MANTNNNALEKHKKKLTKKQKELRELTKQVQELTVRLVAEGKLKIIDANNP